MNFKELEIKGVYLIILEPYVDERGSFSRSFDREIFEKYGIDSHVEQCNISVNPKMGTFRGLHRQTKPFEESKLLRCVKGSIYDVILDLRPESDTCFQWVSVTLDSRKQQLLFVPKGCANGFLTLQENTEVIYQASQRYVPEYESNVVYNDKRYGIKLPFEPKLISKKDLRII